MEQKRGRFRGKWSFHLALVQLIDKSTAEGNCFSVRWASAAELGSARGAGFLVSDVDAFMKHAEAANVVRSSKENVPTQNFKTQALRNGFRQVPVARDVRGQWAFCHSDLDRWCELARRGEKIKIPKSQSSSSIGAERSKHRGDASIPALSSVSPPPPPKDAMLASLRRIKDDAVIAHSAISDETVAFMDLLVHQAEEQMSLFEEKFVSVDDMHKRVDKLRTYFANVTRYF